MNLSTLPHVNAFLNTVATVLLLVGLRLIRQRREQAHKRVMLTCFAVSVAFLCSYLVYHNYAGHQPFPDYPPRWVRTIYLSVLLTHILLAMTVPFLAIATIVLGLKDRRALHRRFAKITFPIWLYVSVTGIFIYVMLYQIYPPVQNEARLKSVVEQSVVSASQSRE